MKQYDFIRAWKNDASYDIDGPVILLTIEELRELWDTALGWGPEVKDFNDKSHTFTTYLTSKGIL